MLMMRASGLRKSGMQTSGPVRGGIADAFFLAGIGPS